MIKIDTHAHWFPPEWVDLVAREGGANGAEIARDEKGKITRMTAPGINRAGFAPQYVEIPIRLKLMDEARVDMHALSLTSPMVYWATPEFGLKLSQVFNDACAAAHLKYPEPLRRHGDGADAGAGSGRGGSRIARRSCRASAASTWRRTSTARTSTRRSSGRCTSAARRSGCRSSCTRSPRSGASARASITSATSSAIRTETGIAAASLVFGGVMDAFPKLDVMLPHAGGMFPSLIGRMDHGTTVRKECKHMTKPPSSYLRRFHYDTITHSDSILMNLIRQVGADRVVMGSDCPADMSYTRPVDVIERLGELSAGERDSIVSGNAARLLKTVTSDR